MADDPGYSAPQAEAERLAAVAWWDAGCRNKTAKPVVIMARLHNPTTDEHKAHQAALERLAIEALGIPPI